MTYPLPPDVVQKLQSLVSLGQYGTEGEVLRAALSALEREQLDLASIRAGMEDFEAGRHRPLAEFEADFRQRNQIADDV